MPFGGAYPEPVLEPLEKGSRQRNFGKQDQHLPALPQRLGHRLEIDLRLARTGDAVDQGHREFACAHRRGEFRGGIALVGGQRAIAVFGIRARHHGRLRHLHRFKTALLHQSVDNGSGHARRMGKAGFRPGLAIAGKFQHRFSRRRHPVGLMATEAQPLHRWRRIEGAGRAQDHARHHSRRRQRVLRDPVDEVPHVLADRRAIELHRHFTQLFRIDPVAIAIPHDTRDLPWPKRHLHDVAWGERHAVRHRVAIGLAGRYRQKHADGFGRFFQALTQGEVRRQACRAHLPMRRLPCNCLGKERAVTPQVRSCTP